MFICDAHNDLLMNLSSKAQIKNYILNNCKTNKVVKIFTAYYVSQNQEKNLSSDTILKDIKNKFQLIKDFDICMPTMENIGFIKNYKQLDKLIELRPYCVTLTWNFDNKLAGGAFGKGHLSNFGKEVVSILEKNNIKIDVAHLNKTSFLEFTKITKFPIFCSHTSSKCVYNIPRGIDRQQMEIIKESDGFIGLCLYNTLLSKSVTDLKVICKHIKSFLEITGENILGFGTDFNATGECNPENFNFDYNGMSILKNAIKSEFGEKICNKICNQNFMKYYCNY